MATTTNYNWATPDDTDLVKDGASAIRTLGSSADTTVKDLNPGTTAGDIDYYTSSTAKARVAIGTANQVLQVNSGATAPEWGVDPVADVITTAGDLIYGSAADTVARLGIGTAGQVLQVNSGATAPEWASASAGSGKVLQVVQATTSTAAANSTTTYADTNLTASITPSADTSKVLVIVHQNGTTKSNGNVDNANYLKLLRGVTDLTTFGKSVGFTSTAIYNYVGSCSTAYLDSPNTTSATTYKTQFKNDVAAAAVGVQTGSATSTITLMEIGA